MKKRCLPILVLITWWSGILAQTQIPTLYTGEQPDVIEAGLNHKAALAFEIHQAPRTLKEWGKKKAELKSTVWEKSGAREFHDLPLDYRETRSHKLDGVTVKNIYFQTRPGVYATANLYIPEGKGPFPAVVTMMGHSSNGRLYDEYQAIGQSLARNGYVSLHMDPWGAGERTTVHGEFQYHGAHLGASLFDIGVSLMGMQITDNIRGVDLLCSLPFVDSSRIGATGASGGGNQTMWLAAMDERVKATMPVVSVGTFQSYIMASNCVGETLVDGLTFAEESEILGMVAPRALKMVNAGQEANKAFLPEEMKRSVKHAQPIFDFYNVGKNLDYQVFDMTHGYHPVVREALLGWMDLHLMNKGDGSPRPEGEINLLSAEELMTFESGKRPAEVMSTADYCKENGKYLKDSVSSEKSLNIEKKKTALRSTIKNPIDLNLRTPHSYGKEGDWDLYALETSYGYLIPLLIHEPSKRSSEYIIIAHQDGKSQVSQELIRKYEREGKGILLVDFWGMGENSSSTANRLDGKNLPGFHTLSRSLIWLGETMQGRWVEELEIVIKWMKNEFSANVIDIHAFRDLGPAFYSALNKDVKSIIMEDAPISYLFDDGMTDNFYTMAIHVPKILQWGDLSLASAMSGADISILSPRTMSGKECKTDEINQFKGEYTHFLKQTKLSGTLEIK